MRDSSLIKKMLEITCLKKPSELKKGYIYTIYAIKDLPSIQSYKRLLLFKSNRDLLEFEMPIDCEYVKNKTNLINPFPLASFCKQTYGKTWLAELEDAMATD